MERWIRAGVVSLAVLLAWNGAVADEKTADEKADDHACIYFSAIDFNGDGVATYFDYLREWLRVPLIGEGYHLFRDAKRQMGILKQFVQQFPLTDRNVVESLCDGGITMDEFLDVVRAKRHLPIFERQIYAFVKFLFDALTYDGDPSVISRYEFDVLYDVFNITGAETSFSKLDANGDKKISYDEANPAAVAYFTTGGSPYLIGPPSTCDDVRRRVPTCVDPIAEGRLVLSPDSFGSVDALINLLRSDPGLNALLNNLLPELLGPSPALVDGAIA